MVQLFVEIRGPIDSRALWDALSAYDHTEFQKHTLNLTDMGETVIVYGTLSILEAVTVAGICGQYGTATATIERV